MRTIKRGRKERGNEMKFQRIAGRLAAGMMTGAVLLTTFGGNALAATEVTPLQEMKYKKIVTTDGHTYAPDTSFSFTLTPVDHSKDTTQATFADNVVFIPRRGWSDYGKGNHYICAVRDSACSIL